MLSPMFASRIVNAPITAVACEDDAVNTWGVLVTVTLVYEVPPSHDICTDGATDIAVSLTRQRPVPAHTAAGAPTVLPAFAPVASIVVAVTVDAPPKVVSAATLLLAMPSIFRTNRAPLNLAHPLGTCLSKPSKSVTYAVVARVKVGVLLPVKTSGTRLDSRVAENEAEAALDPLPDPMPPYMPARPLCMWFRPLISRPPDRPFTLWNSISYTRPSIRTWLPAQ